MSEDKREIVVRPEIALTPHSIMHPLVEQALARMQPAEIPAALEKMMQLQERFEANQSRKAFDAALCDLKRVLPPWIAKNKDVTYNGKKVYSHATLAHIMDAVTERLGEYGFSMRWSPANSASGGISVTVKLSHRDGHTETATLSGPPDKSGSKSEIQSIGSTASYLARYTAMLMLGLASGDMDDADDHKEDVAPAGKVDSARNMRAIAGIIKAGRTKEEAEKLVGRTVAEWTVEDLDTLREWMTPPETAKAEPAKPEAKPKPRPINEAELTEIKGWMHRYEISPLQFAGLIKHETGRTPKSAKDVDAEQYGNIKSKFDRLEKMDGSIDFNRTAMKFSEPPPPEKSALQLEAEAKQEGLQF